MDATAVKYKNSDIILTFIMKVNGVVQLPSSFNNIRIWILSDIGYALGKFSMNSLEGHDHTNFKITDDAAGIFQIWIPKASNTSSVPSTKYKVYIEVQKTVGAPWSKLKTSKGNAFCFELLDEPMQ